MEVLYRQREIRIHSPVPTEALLAAASSGLVTWDPILVERDGRNALICRCWEGRALQPRRYSATRDAGDIGGAAVQLAEALHQLNGGHWQQL